MVTGLGKTIYDTIYPKLIVPSIRKDKNDWYRQATLDFMRGYIDRASFAVVMSWCGLDGLEIVELTEDIESSAHKIPYINNGYKYVVVDDELCLIQQHSL